jgi:capsular polysaccharide biosynthesis protein
MEIDEVAARILRRYWRILLIAVLVPVAVVAFYYVGRPPMYTSDARLVATDIVPKSAAEADAVTSEARAFATSRNVVADAIDDVRASRDPDAVLPHVSVTGLGSSPIVELSVSDADADTARLLTQSLATRVVEQLGTSRAGGVDTVLRNIDDQLTQLASKRAPLAAAAAAAPRDPVAQNRLAGIDRLISDLSADRNKVSLDAAAIGQPRVVQPAVQPTTADSPGLVPRLGLAALLGLVVGVAISAWVETIRPTVPGAPRVARLLDAPLLGSMAGSAVAAADVGRRVRLAASRAGVRTVVLVGTGRRPLPPRTVAAIAAATLPDTYGPADGTDRGADSPTGADAWTGADTEPIVAVRTATDTGSTADPRAAAGTGTAAGTPASADTEPDTAGEMAGGTGDTEDAPPAAVAAGVDNHSRDNGVPVRVLAGRGGRPLPGETELRLAVRSASVGVDGAPAVVPSGRSTPVAGSAARVTLRRVCAIAELRPGAESNPETSPVGLVVVAAPVSRLSAVRAVRDLLTVSAWPLLGVVAERRSGGGATS